MALCPAPPGVDPCPPRRVYQVGGSSYVAFKLCDQGNNNAVVLAVYQICDGEISGAPTYYDLVGAIYTPVGTVGECTAPAVDYEILCDFGTNPATRIVGVWDDQTNPPSLKYYTMAADGSLTAYAAIGPVGACSSVDIETTTHCYQALVDGALGAGYNAGDILHQVLWWDTSTIPPTLTATVWRNQTTNAILTSAPNFADLAPCAEVAPRDCNVSGDVSLNRLGCTGSATPTAVITALSPLSVNTDDPDFDQLCDSDTAIQPESYAAPFPVSEPLRGTTSGMTLYNNAQLTAQAGIDPPGAGWLRLTNNSVTQRGGAIINTPFPSTTAIEFEYTYAVYGSQGIGGADGHSLILLDGNAAIPATMGGDGGALGYASNNAQPGILGGVIGVGLDEYGNFSNPGAGITGTGPGFQPQRLVVRGAGNGGTATGAPGQYPYLVGVNLPATVGQNIDGHPRTAPVKVRGSLSPNGGQMTLNLFMDFGSGYVQVVNGLVINQTLPTQLRIGFSASTGGGTNFHEIRDVIFAPAARRRWRTITPTFAVPPACATAANLCLDLQYTITSDTQTAQGGDNDGEHFIGIALENPAGTYTWLQQREIRSAPIDVGVKQTINLCANGLQPTDLANLRVVVGAETVDLKGSYGVRFDQLDLTVTATGCPGTTVKTMPISAPCPLPVSIQSSGSAIPATVNTIDFDLVCSDLGQLFRQVVYDTSGVPKVTFVGEDGNVVSPTTWTPGACTVDPTPLILPICFTVNGQPPITHQAYKVVTPTATGATTNFYWESDTNTIHQPSDVTETECVKEYDPLLLCDDNGLFIRHIIYGSYGNISGVRDTTPDGADYTVVGTVKTCAAAGKPCATCR